MGRQLTYMLPRCRTQWTSAKASLKPPRTEPPLPTLRSRQHTSGSWVLSCTAPRRRVQTCHTRSRCYAARCHVQPPHSWTPRSACSHTSTSTNMWAYATSVTPKDSSKVTPMPTLCRLGGPTLPVGLRLHARTRVDLMGLEKTARRRTLDLRGRAHGRDRGGQGGSPPAALACRAHL